MSDLPYPESQEFKWPLVKITAYLPPEALTSAAAGRITRLVYDSNFKPVPAHYGHGYPLYRDYFMTETRLVNGNSFVDLWQVEAIAPVKEPKTAQVKFRFISRLSNGTFDPIPRNSPATSKYRTMCEHSLAEARKPKSNSKSA